MTRKKSNVKALVLAVTCAILAGGYSGLNPVYAAPEPGIIPTTGDVTYDRGSTELKYASTYDIRVLTVGGVTIGDSANRGSFSANEIVAKKIVGSTGSNPSAISINGATFANGGVITATSLKLNGIDDIKTAIEAKAAQTDVDNNKTNISDLQNSKADAANVYTKTESDSNFARKNYEGKVDALETTVNNASTGLDAANGKITALEGKTTGISYDFAAGTTVNDVTFNAGAVSGVKSINDKIKISDDGTVTINENATNNPVTINSKGIKVGNNSAVVSEDGFKTSGDLYVGTKTHPTEDAIDARFYVNGADGSIKAADGKFTVNGTNGETVVTGTAGTTTITGSGVTISKAASSEYVSISEGSIFATDSIKAAKIISAGLETRMADGKVVAKNGLYVGYSSTDITGATYDNSKFAVDGATGNTAVGGTLDVAGETTFANGIKTDTIVEKTANAGVTVNGNKITTDNKFNDVELKNGNVNATDITANGALKGASLNVTNNATVGGTLGVAGATTLGSTLEVTSDTTLHGALNAKGKATFGNAPGALTEIDGDKLKTGVIETNLTQESNIGGVKMSNGKITASNMEITGAISLNDLTVNNKLTVGAFSVDKTGAVTGLQSINGVAVAKSGTGLTIGSATIGDANPFSSTGFTVDATGNVAAKDITADTYNGNTIGADNKFNGVELKGGDVKAMKVTADTITDGTATMTGGTVTANTITANTSATLAGVKFDASGVDFNGKDIKNVTNVTATTADLGNLHIEGANITNRVDPIGGAIGLGTTVTVNNAGALGGITKIDGVNVTDDAGGLAIGTGATQVTIGGANAISVGAGTFTVDSAGLVTGNQFTTTNGSYLKDNELKLNDANIWNTTEGLKAEKAVIGANTLDTAGISTTGTLGVEGVATFGKDAADQTKITQGKAEFTQGGKTTTIKGGEIETDKLTVNDIVLKNSMKDGAGNTITIKGSDGSMSVAGGKFAVDDKGQVTNHITATGAAAADTIFTTSEKGINATFQKTGETATSGLTIEDNHAALNASGGAALDLKDKTATLGIGTDSLTTYTNDTIESKVGTTTVTTKSGGTTFGDGTANNTLINGSSITSTKDGTFTTINGSSVRSYNSATGAGHLNGATLNLWKDSDNATYMTAGGATFTGANGRSDATGAKNQTIIDGGIITTDTLNVQRIELGDKLVDSNGTSLGGNLSMDEYGNIKAAGGKFTVAGTNQTNPGALHNEVGNTSFDTTETGASMKYNNGTVESNVSVGDNSAKISAGTSSIEVKNDGITNNGKTTFKGAGDTTVPTTETTINGNTITTGHLITDKLTITGSGNADGTGSTSGSIAFGGNGSITSNIKDAVTGKEATFKTDEKGTFTEAKDGSNVTTNTVNAQGNTNEVTDGTNTSTATQTATSIGGVVTNGTVTMRQELTADGVKVSVDGDTANYTQITNTDVSITDQKNPGKRINLSDLGQLNDLDGELTARDEYTNNKTAVGAINAEAAIRREEVARLDGRINDVNDRVNKVGAMAAAIASLKSIGYDPQAPSEFSIGLGQYKGETGVAMGFFHYPNKNFMINVSLSTAGGETMGGIGATWRFGHKSPQKLLEEQREAQAKKELAAAEKYQAAAKLAKEAQERAEYAAKLARQAQVSADNAKAAADATQAKHFG